jgi:16S rRNA (guanine(966)-N(2))-methyltransferase RsmD
VRIISGTARGIRLESTENPALRPMIDRVKESLFNILQWVLPEARVLDLFSGSGALGLETLSRGAASCVFVESDPELARLLLRNAAKCRLADRCRLVQTDVLHLPERPPDPAGLPADLVLCDPPYIMIGDPNTRADLFDELERLIGAWIAPGAVLMLHHEPLPHAIWPAERLAETDKRIYGRSQLTFFEVAQEGADG